MLVDGFSAATTARPSSGAARIALFGGTFDPIHHGHLILAREAIELLDLDRVIFIPAALSPHKLATRPAPPEIRCAMVAAAIEGEPRFAIDTSELDRSPSFSIDTVEAWRAREPQAALFYFIGEDNVRALGTWRRIDELQQWAQFVVFGRSEHDAPHDFPTIERRIDISATDIRARVARGASIRYLVPEPVRVLLEQHRLYLEPHH